MVNLRNIPAKNFIDAGFKTKKEALETIKHYNKTSKAKYGEDAELLNARKFKNPNKFLNYVLLNTKPITINIPKEPKEQKEPKKPKEKQLKLYQPPEDYSKGIIYFPYHPILLNNKFKKITNNNQNINLARIITNESIKPAEKNGYNTVRLYIYEYGIQKNIYKDIDTTQSKSQIRHDISDFLYSYELGRSNDTNYLSIQVPPHEIYIMTMPVKLISNPPVKEKMQFYKNGQVNCFFQSLRSYIKSPRYINVCNELEKAYLKKGVCLLDIPLIADKVYLNITIKNNMGKTIYEYKCRGKGATAYIGNIEFNHVVPYEQTMNILDKRDKKHVVMTKEQIQDIISNTENERHNIIKTVVFGKYNNVIGLITPYEAITTIDQINDKTYFSHEEVVFEKIYRQFAQNEYLPVNSLLYRFIKNGVKYPDTWYSRGNHDLSKYIAIDKNKAYYAYKYNTYYDMHKLPNTLMGPYRITDQKPADLILLSGYSRVVDVNYDLTATNINDYKILYHLLNIEDGSVLPNNLLWFLWHKFNVRFNITHVAFSCSKKDLQHTELLLENKLYQILIGLLNSTKDRVFKIHGKNKENFVKEFNQTRSENEADNFYMSNTDSTYAEYHKPRNNKRTLSHIAGYIVGYSIMTTLEKLKTIDFDEVIKIKVDCITTLKKNIDKFTIDESDPKHWKTEDIKWTPHLWGNEFLDFNAWRVEDCRELTTQHLFTKRNVTLGSAGCGKTAQYLEVHEKDMRLDEGSFIMVFPSHDLLRKKQKETNNKYTMMTYQKVLADTFQYSGDIDFSKIKHIVWDECSMSCQDDIIKMLKICDENNFNLHCISDLDQTRVYQLKPVEGELAEYDFYIKNGFKVFNLTKNHRQDGDNIFKEKLTKIRQENSCLEDIKKMFNDRIITTEEMYKRYTVSLDNIILSSVNDTKDEINTYLYKNNDNVVYKSLKTNKEYAKNEKRMATKKEYKDLLEYKPKNYALAYSSTIHSCQGLTYTGDVYICIDHIEWTDNLLYVAISRARKESQIYLVSDKI